MGGSRWGGAAALAVGLAAVAGLSSITLPTSDVIWHAAPVPDAADAGDFRVQIVNPDEDVVVMGTVQNGPDVYESAQSLVAVLVRYDFLAYDTVINDVALVSQDGYRYEALNRYSTTHSRLQSGFTSSGALIFEAPEDKLNGASVEFCRTTIVTERRHCARLDDVVTADTFRHDGAIILDPADLTYEVIR